MKAIVVPTYKPGENKPESLTITLAPGTLISGRDTSEDMDDLNTLLDGFRKHGAVYLSIPAGWRQSLGPFFSDVAVNEEIKPIT